MILRYALTIWLNCIICTSATTTEELLEQLSWSLRLKIWAVNQTVESFGTDNNASPPPQFDFANPTELPEIGDEGRRVGIQSLVNRRAGSTIGPSAIDSGDENKMRLKLFRLMYETVRDSDLKVKRAELVQKNYDTFSSFKVGMFMGELQDKYTVMTDISSTLKKFHTVWKPIEHINAYEQIANAGIEISQLIEHLRAAGKRAEKEREFSGPPPQSPPPPTPAEQQFVEFASGFLPGHHYRYSFYWEYENDGLDIYNSPKNIQRFDPARSRLGVLMRGYYEDARIRSKELNNIRFVIEETFQYEVGYLMHEMYERYRKLVEQYNKGERNRSLDYLRLYNVKKPKVKPQSLIFGNDKIERTEVAQKLYFEIYHFSNMIHEVTRKWGVYSKDVGPAFGKQVFYDEKSYRLHQEDMQKQKDKYLKKLYKERDRIMNKLYKDRMKTQKKKTSKSNEQFGVDKDAEPDTNDFIKDRLKDQGWKKYYEKRSNGSVTHRPIAFYRDYGWDVTYLPGQGH